MSFVAISAFATIAGAGISAYGAYSGGQSQKAMYGYQAGIAQLKEKIDLQNRDYAISVGGTESELYGRHAAQRMGQIKADQGASGVDVNTGSAVQVQKGQQTATNIDMAQIRTNAARKAYGFEVEATQDKAQSDLYLRAGEDAERAGDIKAIGSLVSGVSGVSNKWLQYGANFGGGGGGASAGDPLGGM